MKPIILDYLKRWSLVLAAIFIAYFVIQALSVHKNYSQAHDDRMSYGHMSAYQIAVRDPFIAKVIHGVEDVFIFQVIMWLGFVLMWEFQRGIPRVLINMPVTAKQIGRACWLASVAFPAIAVGLLGLLATLIFSGGTSTPILVENYLAGWVVIALYLGAMFGAQTFMATTMTDTFIGKLPNLLFALLFALALIGFLILLTETLTLTMLILFFSLFAILSILGWFRAERMVLQRAGFRLIAQSSRKGSARNKIPRGFGGLPYLAQRTFIQTTLIGLALISVMTLAMSFFLRSDGQNRAEAIFSMIDGGSAYFIFLLIFSICPMIFQLRVLRTLPVSSSALAALLVFLPVVSIAAIGVIVTVFAGCVAGATVTLHAVNTFLLLGAKTAVMVSVIVWRGLDAVTIFLFFLMVVADSFISLVTVLIFHAGSKTPEHPFWIYLIVFFLCVAASLALTRRLLTKSSNAYRVRTLPANAWNMARR